MDTLYVLLLFCISFFTQSVYAICTKKTDDLLVKNKIQEAIWILEDEECIAEAHALKEKLRAILQESSIVEKSSIGSGATRPKILTFSTGTKAVFKRKKWHPSSNYKSEIAAYLIDQIGSFRLVPMTVMRSIDGKKGSLQYFVSETHSAAKQENYYKSHKLMVFDYLIKNKDRNKENVLLLETKEVAIDHGLALRHYNVLGSILNFQDNLKFSSGISSDGVRRSFLDISSVRHSFPIDPIILKNLSNVSRTQLSILEPYLSASQINQIYKRIQNILSISKNDFRKS